MHSSGKDILWIVNFLILLQLFIACSKQKSIKIPDRIKKLENLTIYSIEENPDTILLNEEQSFGNSDEVLIGAIISATVDDLGRVYIADIKNNCIYVFQDDGSYLTQMGNEGRGPGEFNYISKLKTISEKLFAVDNSLSRINVFSLDSSTLSATINVNPKNISEFENINGAFPRQYFIRSDGKFLVSFSWPHNLESDNNPQLLPFYVMDRKGELQGDKIMELRGRVFLQTTIDGKPRTATFPFLPYSVMAMSKKDYIYFAYTKDFLIKVLSPTGAYLRSFYYPYDRVPIDRDDLLDDYTHRRHQKIIRNADLPEAWPALNEMLVDDENRLWIATIVDDQEVYQWWVLDTSDGSLLARFDWPRDKPIEEVKSGKLYARETDEETGLQEIVRYNIKIENQ